MVEGTRLVRRELAAGERPRRPVSTQPGPSRAGANPRRRLGGRFCYVVELVASALTREAQVLEVASRLARACPAVVAGSITSYAGGAIGHDPDPRRRRRPRPRPHAEHPPHLREPGPARAAPRRWRTCTRSASRTCSRSPATTRTAAEPGATPARRLRPRLGPARPADRRDAPRRACRFTSRWPCRRSSTSEADCVVPVPEAREEDRRGRRPRHHPGGLGRRKFRELQALPRRARPPHPGARQRVRPRAAGGGADGARASRRAAGSSPALLEVVRDERAAPRRGRSRPAGARAPGPVAVLRGLGYAGRLHRRHPRRRAGRSGSSAAPRSSRRAGSELADELGFGDPDGFYLSMSDGDGRDRAVPSELGRSAARRPATAGSARCSTGWAALLPVTRDTWLRRALARVSAWVDRRPRAGRARSSGSSSRVKQPLFGCQACGNCVLGAHGVRVPADLPEADAKRPLRRHAVRALRGGRPAVHLGPGVRARRRPRAASRVLRVYIPPPDRSLRGTSSWINYFLDRDRRPLTPDT